jgi:hypothetical protein
MARAMMAVFSFITPIDIADQKPAPIATPYSDIRIIATNPDCCVTQI